VASAPPAIDLDSLPSADPKQPPAPGFKGAGYTGKRPPAAATTAAPATTPAPAATPAPKATGAIDPRSINNPGF
jgi:hypothetical protein